MNLVELIENTVPIYAGGDFHRFGLLTCGNLGILSVIPILQLSVYCPICGMTHSVEDNFKEMTIQRFIYVFKEFNENKGN